MSPVLAGVLQPLALVVALGLVHRPLGDHMARVYRAPPRLRVEKRICHAVGAGPTARTRWPAYLREARPGLDAGRVAKQVGDHTEGRTLGFTGEPRANVPGLDIALKELVAGGAARD
ncbi:hypothetical protein GCM10010446_06940 [Streptomyces enissocaesilis]|uniref:Uncharacterized protein n=1 Tax=Streptomyces enissocaesilis TaxID=332589 RepID=A0ABP6JBE4_9ACTN